MNHIVLDLEFTQPYMNKQNVKVINEKCPFEIIELGAVKLNDEFEVIDSFRMYVKPKWYHWISKAVTRKTKITYNDVQYGFELPKVIKEFIKWIGEEYLIYTWSDNDYIIMRDNCEFQEIKFDWFDGYIDIQHEYKKFKKDKDPMSLKRVIDELNIPDDIPVHSGLNDAKYTSEILRFLKGKTNLKPIKKRKITIKEREFEVLNNNNYKKIKCPNCAKFVKRDYESKRFSTKKKYTILSYCNSCNAHLLTIAKRTKLNEDNVSYKVKTSVIDKNSYNSTKKQLDNDI